jgi:hypothetical protein
MIVASNMIENHLDSKTTRENLILFISGKVEFKLAQSKITNMEMEPIQS